MRSEFVYAFSLVGDSSKQMAELTVKRLIFR